MKKLILVALLAINCAYADTAATFPNNSGGMTVLTDVPCERSRGYYAYAQNPRARTLMGCWWSDTSMVHINWSDGDFRSYPISFFSPGDLNTTVLNRMRSRDKGTL